MAGLIKRKNNYYAVYYVGGRERRRSLDTSSHQVAKERLLNLEIALAGGDPDSILPTKTPLADLVAAYCLHIQANKTKNSIKVDTWYLRSIFGSICPALEIKSTRGRKKDQQKKPREKGLCLEVLYIEHITTAMIAEMIDTKVQRNGIGPKTANRYREIMMRFITWAMDQRGVRMPGGVNPAIKVERRRQPATKIRFLSLDKIEEQLNILEEHPQLQVMVATYIYAGLRREELLWLTTDDMEFNAGRYGMIRVQAKTVQGEHWEPKTKVNRAIPISSTLRDILDRYHPKKVKGGWFFPSKQGKRWDPDNFSHHLQTVNKKAELVWTCLDYRHTFGSQLAMKGESLYKISALMGNSPDICRRHYAALIPEALSDSVEFPEHKSSPPSPPHLRLLPKPEAGYSRSMESRK